MLTAQKGPDVKYHNIVGRVDRSGYISQWSEDGDGVVGFKSAHLNNVASEKEVVADHMGVHRHPLATLDVRKILLEHLTEVDALTKLQSRGDQPILPEGYQILSTGSVSRLPPATASPDANLPPTVVIPAPATPAATGLPRPIAAPPTIPRGR
jgi:hypothetical protein